MHRSKGESPPSGGSTGFSRWGFDLAWCLILLGLGWWLRGTAASAFVTWDEPAWVYRSAAFLTALRRGDWALTLQTGHPGVLTMWSGALSLAWHEKVTGLVTPAQLEAIAGVPWHPHDVSLLRQLDALLPLAKGGAILLQNVLLVGLYLLMRRVMGRSVACAASAFLLSDPFYLALARVLHLDALTSALMLASFLAALIYLREGKRHTFLLAGFLMGLALLSKTYALLVAPCLGGVWLARLRARRDRSSPSARWPISAWLGDGLLALLVAAGTYAALWPAVWASPLEALRAVFGLSLQYASEDPAATTAFFHGHVVEHLGPTFYAVAVWFRSTPLTLLGTALAIVSIVLPDHLAPPRHERATIGALLGYAVLYLALIGLGLKKFDRYALPALLAIDVAAALGWCWVAREICAPFRRSALGANDTVFAAWAIQGVLLLGPLYPAHYLAYYNPLAGGLPQAIQTLPVGWGEGIEKAAQVLASRPDASSTTVATWAVAGLAATYPGLIVPLTAEALPQADLVLLYIADTQALSPEAQHFWGRREPLWVGTVGGQGYVWLYENDYGREILSILEESAHPGDLAVSNLPSRLARQDRSAASWLIPPETDEASLAAALNEAYQASASSSGAPEQVFFVSLDAETARSEILRRLFAENGLLIRDVPFEYGTLRVYHLLSAPSFQTPPIQQPMQAQIGQDLVLEGYGLARQEILYRQELGLSLSWRALRPSDEDLHLSLQIVDEAGNVWGQRDFPLRDASGRGTASWEGGERAFTHESIPLDAGAPPGEYAVRLRVYALRDLQPLPILSAPGSKPTMALILAPCRVLRAKVPPSPEELPAVARTRLALGDRLEILGYTLGREAFQSGEEVPLTLFMRALRAEKEPYLIAFSLLDQGQTREIWRGVPIERYPTTEWAEGEVLRYPYRLRIPPDMPSGAYTLAISLSDAQTGAPLMGEPVPLVGVTVTYRERLWQAPPMRHSQRAELGGAIALLGYDLETAEAHAGGTVHLTLYWQSLQTVAEDYHVFTHLVDASGQIYGQRDGTPARGERPTSGWIAGEVIVDEYEIPIRAEAPAGVYRLLVGMYSPTSGERLRVVTFSTGQPIEEAERRIALEAPLVIGPRP